MRFFHSLAALILPLAALAAKKSSGDRFADYSAKQVSSSGPVKLDDRTYDELTKSPRDYSVAVLLTALDSRFQCGLCTEFQPEWQKLAKQWIKGDKEMESKLVFGTLDFTDGKTTFQTLMLQTAPVLLLFHPTTGPHAKTEGNPTRFDFNQGTNKAEPIHAWISRQLTDRPHPPFVRPVNYVMIAVGITGVLGLITFGTIAAPYLLPVIQNRNLWATVSLILVLLFTSGHMYNHIRSVPYVSSDGKGGLSYFAGGFQNQFGLETQIIAAMYGVLSFASIFLALKVPRMAEPRAQQLAVIFWSAILISTFSFLMSIFRIKNGGYPFYLPPFT